LPVGEEKLQQMQVFALSCLSACTESRNTGRMFIQMDARSVC